MSKIARRIWMTVLAALFTVSLALLCVACTQKPSGGDAAWTDDLTDPGIPANPYGPQEEVEVSTVLAGDVRIQLLSPTLVRIEQKGEKGFEDRSSYYVVNRNRWQVVSYEEKTEGGEKLIVTSTYTVHVPENAKAEDVYITGKNGNRLYDYLDDVGTNVYLPSPSDELKSWYFTDSPRIIPSESGYSGQTDEPLQGWDFDNKSTDIFVFLPDGSYSAFCKDYVNLTGSSEMVTLNTFGYWDSRWYVDSAETALQRINDYIARGYSIDVLVVDVDYKDSIKNGQWGVGYEINEALFPDMAGFLQKCHELGVSVTFNDHPIPVEGTNNLLDKDEVEYRDKNLKLFLSLGVDYWWYDRNWDACLNQIDPDISVYATGMYAFQFITQSYYESITDINEYARRALIMGNVDGLVNGKWMYASDVSAHRYSIQWTGDIGVGSNDLAAEIYNAVFGGAENGLPYMSSDMGGFKTTVSDEQYIRWFQYCALSSIIRAHADTTAAGQDGRMPWLYGELAEEVAHTYQDMRYRLLPLYYQLAHRNYEEGLPILSRTDIAYPEYAEASANDQYMLGDYILVAPISDAELKQVPDGNLFHLEGTKRVSGLNAEYFATREGIASRDGGTPAYTGVASNVYFDWGKGSPSGLPADDFSVRFKGYIKFDKKASLKFYADDDILVYIDGELVVDGSAEDVYNKFLATPEYAAGSVHTIEVLYADRGANANVFMYLDEVIPSSEVTNSRTVFIPDGTWIDVWTGERFVGPCTYTVTHTLRTSPIFVREGAIVPLAQNGTNTGEIKWDKMTLDVYPSANYNATATVYEDDTATVAYKDGNYRTTDITMTHNGKVTTVNIAAAVGSFEGDLAFTKRTWNVRLHKNPEWGEAVSVRINGKNCKFDLIGQSKDAKPFAFSGAALDGDVFELTFEGWVYADYKIEIEWKKTAPSAADGTYDRTEVDFELSHGISGNGAVLDNGTLDWVSYGVGNEHKSDLIAHPESYDAAWAVGGVSFCSEYTENGKSAFDLSALASNINLDWTIKTVDGSAYYVFYLGGEYCTADFTVRDRAGNVQTVTFGNMNGAFTRRVVIKVNGGTASELYAKYSVNSGIPVGTETKSYITAISALVSETLPGIEESGNRVTVSGSTIADAEGRVDLTAAAGTNGDWMRFENRGHVQKNGGNKIVSVGFGEEMTLNDFPAEMVYTDGVLPFNRKDVNSGRYSVLSNISLTLRVTPEDKYIVLYAGAWNATCTAEIYTLEGTLLGKSESFTKGDGKALCKRIVFNIDVEKTEIIAVKIVCSDADTVKRGNVSLASVVVSSVLVDPEPIVPPEGTAVSLTLKTTSYDESATVNLSEAGDIDWAHFGPNACKNGGYIDLDSLTAEQNNNPMTDYRVGFDWVEGSGKEVKGNHGGIFDNKLSIDIKVNASVKKIMLWTGGWDAGSHVKVVAQDGTVLYDGDFAERVDGKSNACLLEFGVTAEREEYITVILTNRRTDGGNVVLAAIAVNTIADQKPVEPTYVYSISDTSANLKAGETKTLTVTSTPAQDGLQAVWTSSDETVATVADGVVTAKKAGTATIKATVGGQELTCTVTVTEAAQPSYEYSISDTSANLKAGETKTLTVTSTPEQDGLQAVWTSSDETVATVADGVVTAKKAGTATIKATVGGKELTCTVTVTEAAQPSYEYSISDTSANLKAGETKTLTVTSTPAQDGLQAVWTSSDETVATVADGVVTAKKAGTATIKATVGGKELTCTVTVTEVTQPSYEYSISDTSANLKVGETKTLTVTSTPEQDGLQAVWTSSDETVATVADGVVTAKKAGTATIKATVGGQELTCTVTVSSNVTANITDLESSYNLSALSGDYATIDWRYFAKDDRADNMKNGAGLIQSDANTGNDEVGDYQAAISWTNGTATVVNYGRINGKFTGESISVNVTVNASVKQIWVFCGAYHCVNTVKLMNGETELAAAQAFESADGSVNRLVVFDFNSPESVSEDVTLTVVLSLAQNGAEGANVSLAAIAVLGTDAPEGTTATVEREAVKELTGGEVNLPEKGTEDWYYPGYNNGARKENGSMIQPDTLTYRTDENLGTAPDYMAEIVLSDTEKSHNFHFSAYMGISVELTAGTHTVYVYGTAWKASYRFAVIDGYGKILSNVTAQAATSGESHAYEYAVTLNVPQGGGIYTFRIDPIELNGGNVGLAAIAVMAGEPAVTATVGNAAVKQLNEGDTVNLTEKGKTDWYVPNGGQRKDGGSAISTDIQYENGNNTNPGPGPDYKAEIVLNGSETTKNFCFTDSSIKVEVTLTEGTHTVYVYGTAWQASYRFRTVDMNGEELSNVVAREAAGDGTSEAYEYAVTLNVETAGTYTFEIVAIDRHDGNVGLAAVAVD